MEKPNKHFGQANIFESISLKFSSSCSSSGCVCGFSSVGQKELDTVHSILLPFLVVFLCRGGKEGETSWYCSQPATGGESGCSCLHCSCLFPSRERIHKDLERRRRPFCLVASFAVCLWKRWTFLSQGQFSNAGSPVQAVFSSWSGRAGALRTALSPVPWLGGPIEAGHLPLPSEAPLPSVVPLEEWAGRFKPQAPSGGSLRPKENPLYLSGNAAHPHFLSQIHQLSPTPFSTTSPMGLRALSSTQVQMFWDYRSEMNYPPNLEMRARGTDVGLSPCFRKERNNSNDLPRGGVRGAKAESTQKQYFPPIISPESHAPSLHFSLMKAVRLHQHPETHRNSFTED